MELDSLKYVWHAMEVKPVPGQDSSQILAILQRKSHGPVGKMRRNLMGEFILILLVYTPAVLFYLFEFGGKLSEIAVLLFILMIFFAGYFYRKNQLLKQMQYPACDVRVNLERQIGVLQKYIRFYVLVGTIMIPVMVILSLLIIHSRLPHYSSGSSLYYSLGVIPWYATSFAWVTGLAVLTVGIYYINVWYVNRLYGRHIKKLRLLLDEMNEA
jgi:hypothetical protein